MSVASACPFGTGMQRYWNRLSPEERCMQLDVEALYSLSVQAAALQAASAIPGEHILDPFCGAGGSAIAFARSGKRVTAIELNPKRLEMARYNAELFGVSAHITFIHGDAVELIPSIRADTIFLSPPWGGPNYSQRPLFTFDCFTPDGGVLMDVASRSFSTIALQLPRNFDFNELKQFVGMVSISEDRVGDELVSYTAVLKLR